MGASQAASRGLEIDKSADYPVLAGLATFGDLRTIVSFPKPLAAKGYVMPRPRSCSPRSPCSI